MVSRDTRSASADYESSKLHNEPLLSQRIDHERFNVRDDDIERAERDFSEGFSRQSSFELTDPPFEHISFQRRSWIVNLRRSLSFLARPIGRLKSKAGPANRAKSRSLRVGLYFVAIALMMLLVSPLQFLFASMYTNDCFPEA